MQFEQPLAEFELVKKKIAYMAAHAFAMEATTAECASFIDRGFEDYMLETAMLKVWSTEALWQIVNDTIQIYGGKAYFTDEPYERMMRDARINQIGEGANDVLRAFIAMVGIKPVADQFLKVKDALSHPFARHRHAAELRRQAARGAAARRRTCRCRAATCDSRPASWARGSATSAWRCRRADEAPRGDPVPAVRPGAPRRRGLRAVRVELHAEPAGSAADASATATRRKWRATWRRAATS